MGNIEIMLFVLVFVVGFAGNKLIRRHRVKTQQNRQVIPVVVSKEGEVLEVVKVEEVPKDQAKVIFVPELNEYKVEIKPHRKGVGKDYSIKVGVDGIPRIT